MRDQIDALLRGMIGARGLAGAAAFATTADATIYEGAAGDFATDSVVWLASMTKPLVSVAAMQLIEQGKLTLDGPIADILPALAAPMVLEGFDAGGKPILRPAKGAMTLRHLLTHTSGFSYDTWSQDLSRYFAATGVPATPRNWDDVARTPLLFDPGTRWTYGISTDLVGKAIEAASGQGLDVVMRDHLLGSLGMDDTGFLLSPAQQMRRPTMRTRQADGTLAAMAFPMGEHLPFCLGGGRICGTGADYLRFIRMMLSGGMAPGGRVLQAGTVADMGRNHIGELEVSMLRTAVPRLSNDAQLFPEMVQKWGLGFQLNTEAAPAGRSAFSLAWAGLANTYFWIDPAAGIGGVFLTQVMPFADAPAMAGLAAFEAAIYRNLADARTAL